MRPSTLLGVEDPITAAVFDQAVAEVAAEWELEHRVGEFWWLGLMEMVAKAFGGGE